MDVISLFWYNAVDRTVQFSKGLNESNDFVWVNQILQTGGEFFSND